MGFRFFVTPPNVLARDTLGPGGSNMEGLFGPTVHEE